DSAQRQRQQNRDAPKCARRKYSRRSRGGAHLHRRGMPRDNGPSAPRRAAHHVSGRVRSRRHSDGRVQHRRVPGREFLELVMRVRPTQVTLVPDPPGVLTSNAGWNLTSGAADWLGDVLARLRKAGIRTGLFLDTEARQIRRARELGADRIDLFTGPYANAFGTPAGKEILAAHREAARLAREIGLGVNAGHDLDLKNIPAYAKAVKGLQEVSIGHAL